jgi:hypothetical protein
VEDPKEQHNLLGNATFVDALLGQWWGHLMGFGDLLPAEHCASTVTSVYDANHVDAFEPSRQYPRQFFDSVPLYMTEADNQAHGVFAA